MEEHHRRRSAAYKAKEAGQKGGRKTAAVMKEGRAAKEEAKMSYLRYDAGIAGKCLNIMFRGMGSLNNA